METRLFVSFSMHIGMARLSLVILFIQVREVRKMADKHTYYQSYCLVKRFCRSRWFASVVGSLMITARAMAATPPANQAVVKQLALSAYCSEAQSRSNSMANGSTSYKRIAELAAIERSQTIPVSIPIHLHGNTLLAGSWINMATSRPPNSAPKM